LDQQKELFRTEDLEPESFEGIARSMDSLQLQLVDYRILENRRGHIDLLADLVNEELRSSRRSDAVIFLGPTARYFDKIPESLISEPPQPGTPFFFFQYKPFWRRVPELPDSIALTVKRLKGKILMIHTPADFAKAIKQTEAHVAGTK
jgi:hypothetical protein